jgi:tetratricopeptide (TPR) repeat protein
VGAGRGLFRVRAHPFVDRDAERDAIWEELRSIWSDGFARLIVLCGKAGVGRSRLAEWTAQRAHEVGACTILRATFRDIPGSGDGLGPMLERAFRSEGLDPSETIAQVRRRLAWYGIADEVLARALTRLMRPPIAIDEDAPSGLSPIADRYELLRRFVARIGGIRPVLIWLDDAHFGADGLSFVDHVLSASRGTPVLFIATVSEDALQERLIEVAILESLFRDERTKKITLGPLDDVSHRELIDRLLPFTPSAAEHVAERTMGNPLLAMELVSEWVDRGVLTSSASGFRITPGAKPSVPSGVHEVYLDQLRRILSDRPAWWPALEIAAVIGMEIDQNEWALACEAAHLGVDSESRTELMRRLFRASMARPTARGFVWTQARLRRVLVERAGDEGRLSELHAAAASAAQASAEGLPVAAERLAFHLQQAGRGREATAPLLSAARSLLEASDLVGARAILDRRDALLESEQIPSTDPAWGAGWVLRAEVLLHLGNISEADAIASKGIEMGKRLRWRSVVPASTLVRARIATVQGSLDDARQLLDRAATMYAAENNPAGEAACLRELGYVDLNLGELEEAEEKLKQARDAFEAAGDTIGLGYTYGHLGLLERRRRNYEESSAHYERALELFREKDNRYGVALALNGLGDSLRYSGAIAEAESCYREAEHAYESIAAMVSATTPRLNLALLALERNDHESAFRLAELARPPLEKADKKSNLAVAHALALPRLAATRSFEEFDDRMDLVEELIEVSQFADGDLAWALEVASELCLRANEEARAARALRAATAQLEALRRLR